MHHACNLCNNLVVAEESNSNTLEWRLALSWDTKTRVYYAKMQDENYTTWRNPGVELSTCQLFWIFGLDMKDVHYCFQGQGVMFGRFHMLPFRINARNRSPYRQQFFFGPSTCKVRWLRCWRFSQNHRSRFSCGIIPSRFENVEELCPIPRCSFKHQNAKNIKLSMLLGSNKHLFSC